MFPRLLWTHYFLEEASQPSANRSTRFDSPITEVSLPVDAECISKTPANSSGPVEKVVNMQRWVCGAVISAGRSNNVEAEGTKHKQAAEPRGGGIKGVKRRGLRCLLVVVSTHPSPSDSLHPSICQPLLRRLTKRRMNGK